MTKKNIVRVLFLLIIIIVWLVLRYSGLTAYLTLQNLQHHKQWLLRTVQDHYWLTVFSYIIFYIVVTGFSLPGAAVLTIAGGFLFGILATVFYANIGATVGAIVAFLASRYLLGNVIAEKYGKRLKTFNRELAHHGANYLLMLRLIPIFPFFLINFFAGLTEIPMRTFVWTTMLGIIPASAVFAYAGQQLHLIRSAGDVLSPPVLLAFLLLSLLALLPVFVKKINTA